MTGTDVVIIVALQDELDQLLAAVPGGWSSDEETGYPLFRADLARQDGGTLRVAAARQTSMGISQAASTAARIVERLKPRCLAMCGICAGWRNKTSLGDVIVADRVFQYDIGKIEVETAADGRESTTFRPDPTSYPVIGQWKQQAELMAKKWAESFAQIHPRPVSLRYQEDWLLDTMLTRERLNERSDPYEDPERATKCPDWADVLQRARSRKFVKSSDLALTPRGRKKANSAFVLHRGDIPKDEAFRVHVGPIATGNQVVADPQIFERIHGVMRSTLGIEMESSAIADVAQSAGVDLFLIAKGVSDHADEDKGDRYRQFAAAASARFVLDFLCRFLPRRDTADGNRSRGNTTLSENGHKLREIARRMARGWPRKDADRIFLDAVISPDMRRRFHDVYDDRNIAQFLEKVAELATELE